MFIIKKILYIPTYIYRNILYPKVLSFKYKDILKKNLELKDKYKGKRCFVLGSGPSIKNIDISKLRDEHTFVVNEFNRHPCFKDLNKVNHVLSDTIYFSENSDNNFVKELKNKSDAASPKTTFFLNIYGKDKIKERHLFLNNKIYYLGLHGIISKNFNFNIAMDKCLPWPKNSILLCLMLATYMGFKKIYLLGCEHNFLCFNIKSGQLGRYNHFFKNDDLIKGFDKLNSSNLELAKRQGMERRVQYNYEKNIENILQLFKNYRLFYKKAKRIYPNLEIFNATPNSFLDVFPMINFDDIKF